MYLYIYIHNIHIHTDISPMLHQLIDRGNALVCEHSLLHFRGWEIATFQAAVRSIIATKPELVEKNTVHFNSAGESSSYEVHYFWSNLP